VLLTLLALPRFKSIPLVVLSDLFIHPTINGFLLAKNGFSLDSAGGFYGS
jgi:hypothetical protein